MAYRSKYTGVEVDTLLDKIAADDVGNIDSALSTTSTNPVMNKVVTEELNGLAARVTANTNMNQNQAGQIQNLFANKADKTAVEEQGEELAKLSAETNHKV